MCLAMAGGLVGGCSTCDGKRGGYSVRSGSRSYGKGCFLMGSTGRGRTRHYISQDLT